MRWMLAASLLALGCVLMTTAVRFRSVARMEATPPGVTPTTGSEEESLFALWRKLEGQPVFLSPTKAPFTAAYFNWLFYDAYAAFLRPLFLRTGAGALVHWGRLLTFAGCAAGAIAVALLGLRLSAGRAVAVKLCVTTAAAYLFVGPLLGWWSVTVRPDAWALALETGALVALVALHRTRPAVAISASAALFFAAWSFKQSFVQGLIAGVLFLALSRRFLWAAALGGLFALGAAATVAALGPVFRAAVSEAAASGFDLAGGVYNLVYSAARTAPFAAAVLMGMRGRSKESGAALHDDVTRLAKVGLPLAVLTALVPGAKLGAVTNYYFTATVFLALWALAALSRAESPRAPLVFCGVVVAMCGYLFAFGRLQDPPGVRAEVLAQRWALLKAAPSPRHAADQPLNLPWLNPGAPVFLTAHNYKSDRGAGRVFEHGGIGGLIARGDFASLLLPESTADTFDGASLARYERTRTAAGATLFVLRR